jgi:hypothetical protein
MMRPLSPIPALYRGFDLHPDDEDDPYVFRIQVPWFGAGRVVFSRDPGGETSAFHFGFAPMSFHKRHGVENPRRLVPGVLGAAAVGVGVTLARRRRRRRSGGTRR